VKTFPCLYREIVLSHCNSSENICSFREYKRSISMQVVWGHFLYCTVKQLYLGASTVRTFARLYGEIALSRCNSFEDMSCCSTVQWSSSIFEQLFSGHPLICTVKWLNLGGTLVRTFARLYVEIALSRFKSCEDIYSSVRWNRSISVHLVWWYGVLHVCTIKELYLCATLVRTFARLYGEIVLSRSNTCEDIFSSVR
jgi:hypothetical protein